MIQLLQNREQVLIIILVLYSKQCYARNIYNAKRLGLRLFVYYYPLGVRSTLRTCLICLHFLAFYREIPLIQNVLFSFQITQCLCYQLFTSIKKVLLFKRGLWFQISDIQLKNVLNEYIFRVVL